MELKREKTRGAIGFGSINIVKPISNNVDILNVGLISSRRSNSFLTFK